MKSDARDLSPGMQGDDVKLLQSELQQLGYTMELRSQEPYGGIKPPLHQTDPLPQEPQTYRSSLRYENP